MTGLPGLAAGFRSPAGSAEGPQRATCATQGLRASSRCRHRHNNRWPAPSVRASAGPQGGATASRAGSDSTGGRSSSSSRIEQPTTQSAPLVTDGARSSDRRAPGAAAAAGLEYRLAEPEEYWAVADVHCCAFYPEASAFWDPLLRLDRVLSLQVGSRSTMGRFACLVAAAAPQGQQDQQQHSSSSSSGSSSSSSNGGGGWRTVPMGPLVTLLAKAVVRDSMQSNYAATHGALGIQGAVVLDTMNLFVPPKRIVSAAGNIREVKRPGWAYLSNLAVSPAAQRLGIGRELLLQAEAMARDWDCRFLSLHVDASNETARRLYEREGYREVLRQSACERLLEGRQTPLVLMLKFLGSSGGRGGAET